MRSLVVDWRALLVLQRRLRLRLQVGVDGAGLEGGLLRAADPREFGGRLLWSERRHLLLLLKMNRRSRDGKEEPCLVSAESDASRLLEQYSHSHGLGLKGQNVLLAAHPKRISWKHR